jgi:glycosyltransferase involved in cell wall biosynthesis
MTDPLGQSQVLPYLKGLSQNGYEFHLISFEKPDRYEKHKKHIQSICESSGIHWHPQDYHREGGLRKTVRQVRRMLKVAHYLYSKHQFEIIHCRSYISALAGVALKKKYKTKFVFDMRGFWADERVDGGLWSLSNPVYKLIYKYFKRKEKQFIREANAIVSLTENARIEIDNWQLGKNVKDIDVIPCCVDLERFDPENTSHAAVADIKSNLGIDQETYILGYVGSIGTWYMLEEMLDFYKTLKEIKKQTHFLFISGESEEKIHESAIRHQVDPKEITVISVLHHEVPHYVASFDLSVFFIKPSYSKKASSPTKQGEIMAMGTPLICNSGVGDTDAIVRKYHAGAVVDEFSHEAYLKAIVEVANFDSTETKKGAQEFFGLAGGVANYLEIYKRING